jgi:hypothetical protein
MITFSYYVTNAKSNNFKTVTQILQNGKYGKLADKIAKVNDVGVTILALTNNVILTSAPKEMTKNLNLINPIFSYHIIPNHSGFVENVVTATTLKNEIITFTRDNGELYVGMLSQKLKLLKRI